MRVKLSKYLGQRVTLRGTITALGKNKLNSNKYCVSIKNVTECHFNEIVSEHLWFRVGKHFFKNEPEVRRGDVIKFDARIDSYVKRNGDLEYGVKYPSKFRIVNHDLKMNDELVLTNELCHV